MAQQRFNFIAPMISTISISFCSVMRVLPLPVCRVVGRAMGMMLYALVPRVRNVSIENLRAAYSGTSEHELRAIARGAAINVGIVAAEFAHLRRLTPENIARWVDVEGAENLDRSRKGFFLVGAHLGNWEWMATVVKSLGFEVAEVVRPLDAPALNRYVDRQRTSLGVRTIDKTGGGQELMRLLKEGWVAGVLADQSPRESAVPVTFFGRPCWATVAPAMVTLRMKMPMHVVTMTRNRDDRYTMRISPAVTVERSGNFRADLLAVTQQSQDILEEHIRAHPEQWLWLHRRWKARPRLEGEWEKKAAVNGA